MMGDTLVVSKFEGIRIVVEKPTPQGAYLRFIKIGNFKALTGAWIGLYRFDGQEWQQINYNEGVGIPLMAIQVQNSRMYVDFTILFGELKPGKYRLLKHIDFDSGSESPAKRLGIFLYSDFEIK